MLHFLILHSLLTWFFGGFLTLGSLCLSAIVCDLPQVRLPPSRLPPSPWFLLPFLLLLLHIIVLSCGFLFSRFFINWFVASGGFRRLPSLGVLSPPFSFAILSFCRWVGFIGSPSLSTLFLWCPWFIYLSSLVGVFLLCFLPLGVLLGFPVCNHTFPEYLNSTLSHPRRIYRHVYIPRKRKLPPNGPSYYHR